jgi:hypothetical protein
VLRPETIRILLLNLPEMSGWQQRHQPPSRCRAKSRVQSGMTALSRGAAGCRSRSASTVSLQSGANLSSELKMRMAALMLPSSSFDITAAAIAASQSFDLLTRVSVGGLMTSVTERFKKSDAVLCLRPDRRGAFNMVELKLRNVDHASTDFKLLIMMHHYVSPAQTNLIPYQTVRSISAITPFMSGIS